MHASDSDIIGAVKIKDGLFIGDEYAAQDLEFVVTNKVTHIVNCTEKQVPNHWEPIGVIYLNLNWMETDYQILFDAKDEVFNEIFKFIDGALSKGESILVHSVKGQNRSCCVLAAYFMRKYRWSLYKTLEYLHSRKPNLEIRSNFFTQLMNLEAKLNKLGYGIKTRNWNEIGDDPKNIDSEELLLTNTFLNAKKLPPAEFNNITNTTQAKEARPKINWTDGASTSANSKGNLVVNENPIMKREKSPNAQHKTFIKSILKGSSKIFTLKNSDTLTSSSTSMMMNTTTTTNTNTTIIGSNPTTTTASKTLIKSPSQASNLKDQISSTRSIMASNGASSSSNVLKNSSSVSVLDKADKADNEKRTNNVQGNVIHITVNNFITNNNLASNTATAALPLGKLKLNTGENNAKLANVRSGLMTSNSNKDLISNLSPHNFPSVNGGSKSSRDDMTKDNKAKRGYSPLATSMSMNNLNEKPRNDNDENALNGFIRVKSNPNIAGFNKDQFGPHPSLLRAGLSNSFGLTNLSMGTLKQPNMLDGRKNGFKPLIITGHQVEKEQPINSTNSFGALVKFGQHNNDTSASLAANKNNSSLYKFLTGGKGPIRATNFDLGVGSRPSTTTNKKDKDPMDYNSLNKDKQDNSATMNSTMTITSTMPNTNTIANTLARPSTAPEIVNSKENKTSSKKTIQESPYYSSSLTVYGRTNKHLDNNQIHQRQSSAQPFKENSKPNEKDQKSRLRSSSPGNALSNSQTGFFQELNKPKWKYQP